MAELGSRRLLLVLTDAPQWKYDEDGPRRSELWRYIAPGRVEDYFPIVRNWASTKERIDIEGTVYPVSSGNQVWYTDCKTVTVCLSAAGHRRLVTVPAAWLFKLIVRRAGGS